MDRADLRMLLDGMSNEDFVDRELLRPVPWLFREDLGSYNVWRGELAAQARVAPDAVFLVGSGATGYSLSPLKLGRDFQPIGGGGPPSDLDLAIIAPDVFILAWETIVQFDRTRRLRFSVEDRARLHQDIYFGFVATRVIPRDTDVARHVHQIRIVGTRLVPLRGHAANLRIYRRLEDLRAYHIASLRAVRRELA